MSIDGEDVMQAVEIALGDGISGESFKHRTVDNRDVKRAWRLLRRIVAELPPETTVHELAEAMGE